MTDCGGFRICSPARCRMATSQSSSIARSCCCWRNWKGRRWRRPTDGARLSRRTRQRATFRPPLNAPSGRATRGAAHSSDPPADARRHAFSSSTTSSFRRRRADRGVEPPVALPDTQRVRSGVAVRTTLCARARRPLLAGSAPLADHFANDPSFANESCGTKSETARYNSSR